MVFRRRFKLDKFFFGLVLLGGIFAVYFHGKESWESDSASNRINQTERFSRPIQPTVTEFIQPDEIKVGTQASISTTPEPKISKYNLSPEKAFHPELAELVSRLDAGQKTTLRFGAGDTLDERDVLWMPQPIFSDKFALTIGVDQFADWGRRVYSGIEVSEAGIQTGEVYSMAIIQDALVSTITHSDGSQTVIRKSTKDGDLESLTFPAHSYGFMCQLDSNAGQCLMRALQRGNPTPDWSNATPASISFSDLETAERGGFNPSNNRLDKYVQTIPYGDQYFRSLKPMFMLAVLDKVATAGDTEEELQLKTSEWLAMISNVASVYENQLGIRLILQELILTPNNDNYDDIPASLDNFGSWCNRYRRQSIHRWSAATKWGAGLTGNALGVAYLNTVQGSSAVALMRPNTGWATVAHEMGHNLGSGHSQGGIMNSFDNGGGNRDFFTLLDNGNTAAQAIFNLASSRLPGEVEMRNPGEIPFAQNDSEITQEGEPVLIDVLSNDRTSVRNGEINQLRLVEVGRVQPQRAGQLEIVDDHVQFSPDPEFRGTAYFSYTVGGSVGNNGDGWLHKGDVAVVVGSASPLNFWTMAPGQSISFEAQGNGSATITRQARKAFVHVSKDDNNLIIIRADAGATGTDSFQYRQGNSTITVRLSFSRSFSSTTTDVIVWDKSMGEVALNPLINDELSGNISLERLNLSYGVGTAGQTRTGVQTFRWSNRIISITNMHSSKGRLTTERLNSSLNGRQRSLLTGNITYLPEPDARGIASVRYIIEDAAGSRHTNYVSFILPLADITSPSSDRARMKVGDTLVLKARTYTDDIPPLSGIATTQWSVLESPPNVQYSLSNAESLEAAFSPQNIGKYVISLNTTDEGYSTERKVIIFVDSDQISTDLFPISSYTYWPVEKLTGGTLEDLSGSNIPIFHRNVNVFQSGVRGNGVVLNGSNEYLRLTPQIDKFKNLKEGSISLWFKSSSQERQTIFSAAQGALNEQFFEVFLDDGNLYIDRSPSMGHGLAPLVSHSRFDDGEWHHMILSIENSGSCELLVDGVSEALGRMLFLRGLPLVDELNIGVSRRDGSVSHYFKGSLDEIRIFNRSLSSMEKSHLTRIDIPDSGEIEFKSNTWIVPTGSLPATLFGFRYKSGADNQSVDSGNWNQLSGPGDISVEEMIWDISTPGEYKFSYLSDQRNFVLSEQLSLKAVETDKLGFAWAAPTIRNTANQNESSILDLSNYKYDPQSGSLLIPSDAQYLIASIPDEFSDFVSINDNQLIISPLPGYVGSFVIQISQSNYPDVQLPIYVDYSRSRLPYNPIRLTIPETTSNGIELITIPDLLGIVEPAYYEIISGNHDDTFELGVLDGKLQLKDSRGINYEHRSAVHLDVRITTSDRSGIVPITIGIKDIDEPLVIPDQFFEAPLGEEAAELGAIQFYDPENRVPEFRIVDGDSLDLFEITNPGGILMLTRPDALSQLVDGKSILKLEATDTSSSQADPVTFSITVISPVKVVDGNMERLTEVPINGNDRLRWTQLSFSDSDWTKGVSGIGYERANGYQRWIGLDVEEEMYNVNESVYVRVPFTLTKVSDIESMILRMFYDDGFVAYLNGVKIAESNASENPTWNSGATSSHSDRLALLPEDHIILNDDILRVGQNVLAIHGLNSGETSSDMLVFPELFIKMGVDSTGVFPPSISLNQVSQSSLGRVEWIGNITRLSQESADVSLFYGRRNGGQEAALWDHQSPSESVNEMGEFTRSLSGLEQNTTYFFKLRASNNGLVQWSNTMQLFIKPDNNLVMVDPQNALKYFVPSNDLDEGQWFQPQYDDNSWMNGYSGIGFDSGSDFLPLINTSVKDAMRGKTGSLYTRFKFNLEEPANLSDLKFEMMYDDGFVAYLNGESLISANQPNSNALSWNATAVRSRPDAEAVVFQNFSLPENTKNLLKPGQNILAIHGLNTSASSSDFLMRPRFSAITSAQSSIPMSSDSDFDGLLDTWELDSFGSLEMNGFDQSNSPGLSVFDIFLGSLNGGDPVTPPAPAQSPLEIAFDSNQKKLVIQWNRNDSDGAIPVALEYSNNLKDWEVWDGEIPLSPSDDQIFQLILSNEQLNDLDMNDTPIFFRLNN